MEQFDFEYRYTIQESMILQYQQALQKRAWIRILKWIATVIVVLHAILLVVLLLNAKEPVLFSDWMSICVEIALLVMRPEKNFGFGTGTLLQIATRHLTRRISAGRTPATNISMVQSKGQLPMCCCWLLLNQQQRSIISACGVRW